MIYLDYAAHAPADPAVLERFCDMERRFPANPNSVHAAGKAAREEMARVTEQIAALTGASPAEVIFTSGATEANNLAIKGIAQASRHIGKHIISTPLEHSSVSGSLTALQERGWEIDLLSIGRDGTVDPEEVRELLRPDTVLVAICAVDSELGTIQPVNEIAALLADHPNCSLHVDATQAIGRIPVDFCQPAEPKYYDDIAAAVAACGLIELASLVPDRQDEYLTPALKMLHALDDTADWDEARDGYLQYCSADYHGKEHNVNFTYGDYYFYEALLKLTGDEIFLW